MTQQLARNFNNKDNEYSCSNQIRTKPRKSQQRQTHQIIFGIKMKSKQGVDITFFRAANGTNEPRISNFFHTTLTPTFDLNNQPQKFEPTSSKIIYFLPTSETVREFSSINLCAKGTNSLYWPFFSNSIFFFNSFKKIKNTPL